MRVIMAFRFSIVFCLLCFISSVYANPIEINRLPAEVYNPIVTNCASYIYNPWIFGGYRDEETSRSDDGFIYEIDTYNIYPSYSLNKGSIYLAWSPGRYGNVIDRYFTSGYTFGYKLTKNKKIDLSVFYTYRSYFMNDYSDYHKAGISIIIK